MAAVTGNARFFSGAAPLPRDFTLILKPSGPGFNGAGSFWGPPVEAKPNASGNFTFSVQPTIGLMPHVWYEISSRWLDDAGNYPGRDFPGWRVEVPSSGGDLSQLITVVGRGVGHIWIGPDAPPKPGKYTAWIDNSSPVPDAGMPYYEWE